MAGIRVMAAEVVVEEVEDGVEGTTEEAEGVMGVPTGKGEGETGGEVETETTSSRQKARMRGSGR